MAKVLCCCNNIPDTITHFLTSLGYSADSDISIFEYGQKFGKTPRSKFIYFLEFSDFLRNIKIINSEQYKCATIFIFCTIVNANSISNVILLDVKSKSDILQFSYKNITPDTLNKILTKSFKSYQVEIGDKEYKHQLIEQLRIGSFLNPLMTLLYSVKAEGHAYVKNLIFEFMSTDVPISVLESLLKDSYEWGTISKQCRSKLIELLSSDIGQKYKMAVNEVCSSGLTSSKDIAIISRRYEIDAYEVKYMLKSSCSDT